MLESKPFKGCINCGSLSFELLESISYKAIIEPNYSEEYPQILVAKHNNNGIDEIVCTECGTNNQSAIEESGIPIDFY